MDRENAALCAAGIPCELVLLLAWAINLLVMPPGSEDQKLAAFGSSYSCTVFQM
jgi:hypothetical protein